MLVLGHILFSTYLQPYIHIIECYVWVFTRINGVNVRHISVSTSKNTVAELIFIYHSGQSMTMLWLPGISPDETRQISGQVSRA
jgi:hypothetical protein